MDHPSTLQTRLRRQSRIFGALVSVAVVISLLAVASQIAFVAAPLWKGGAVQPTIIDIGRQIVLSVPPLLYVACLYCARRVFRRIGSGELFARANGEGLRAMGWCLLVGALWAMAAEGLVPYSAQQPLAQTMREVGRSSSDPFLATLGLALVMIGSVMITAARLKTENDQFV